MGYNQSQRTSTSERYNTPRHIVERVCWLFGEIDLDPCSDGGDPPNVPAAIRYTKRENGLRRVWEGRVYMNPPYGKVIGLWVRKLRFDYERGAVTEAVALLPARVDTRWWRELENYPVLFVRGRLKFPHQDDKPGEPPTSAPYPSAIVYLGPRLDDFKVAFGDLGPIYKKLPVAAA